jgi:hypothetical protein
MAVYINAKGHGSKSVVLAKAVQLSNMMSDAAALLQQPISLSTHYHHPMYHIRNIHGTDNATNH